MPPSAETAPRIPLLIILAIATLVGAIVVTAYETYEFILLTYNLNAALFLALSKLISIAVIITLLMIRRPGPYVLAVAMSLEAIFLGATLFGYRIAVEDTLTIAALFLALWYYKKSLQA